MGEAGFGDGAQLKVSMQVAEELIGRVIGPKGAGLRQLRKECGVSELSVSREAEGGMRLIEVIGTAEQVDAAQGAIGRMIETPPEPGGKRKAHDLYDPPPTRPRVSYDMSPGMAWDQAGMLAQMGQPYGQALPHMGHLGLLPHAPMLHQRMHLPPAGVGGEAFQTMRLLVDENKAGMVVGKQGSALKGIREATGVKMEVRLGLHASCMITPKSRIPFALKMVPRTQVEREVVMPGHRLVTLRGNATALRSSLGMIVDLIGQPAPLSPQPPVVSIKLLFASHLAGRVIGKAGAGLKELRVHGVTVEVPRDEVSLHGEPERMLCLDGPAFGVVSAICAVVQKLN